MDSPNLYFVNQHYWPDVASTGQHLTDLAEHLVDAGFNVRVLTSRVDYRGGQLDAPARESRRGVHIRRITVPGFGRGCGSQWGRATDYAAFHLQAALAVLLDGEEVDLVVSLTTPSLLPATIGAACAVRGVPYAIWAMDLHPDIEENLGAIRPRSSVSTSLRAMSRRAFWKAEFVVTIGPHMQRRILSSRGVPPDRLRLIPVWNDAEEVQPIRAENNSLRRELGYGDDDLVVMYSGNAGLAHRFDVVLDAADRLRDRERVYFLFVGDGPRREAIEQEIENRSLPRFRYLDYFPRHELARSLSTGDVHLLTLRREMAGLCAPGKLYGILAAGRPVLMVGPEASDPAEVVRGHEVGTVVDPENVDGDRAGMRLAAEIRKMEASKEHRRKLGDRAREVFLDRFEKESCCRRWEKELRVACSGEHR